MALPLDRGCDVPSLQRGTLPPRCTAATIACAVSYQLIVSDVHATAPSQSRRPGAQERPGIEAQDRTSCPSTRFPPDEHCHPPCVPPGSAPALHRDRYIAAGGCVCGAPNVARVVAQESSPQQAADGGWDTHVEASAEKLALFTGPAHPQRPHPRAIYPHGRSHGHPRRRQVGWLSQAGVRKTSMPPLLESSN